MPIELILDIILIGVWLKSGSHVRHMHGDQLRRNVLDCRSLRMTDVINVQHLNTVNSISSNSLIDLKNKIKKNLLE